MKHTAGFIPFAGATPPPPEANDPTHHAPQFEAPPGRDLILISIPTLELHIKLLREAIEAIRDPAPDRSPRRLRTVTKLRNMVAQLKSVILDAQEAYRVKTLTENHPDGSELKP